MFPFAASTIVMFPEFVPSFVSKTKLKAPLEVTVAAAAPVPTTTSPVPFGLMSIPTLESPPVASNIGLLRL
jgi:hypothetical protein